MTIKTITGCGSTAKTVVIKNYDEKIKNYDERVVDDANFLPMSRADTGMLGQAKYDFNDGKDTGDRTRLRLADSSLDITETDEILKNMKQDIEMTDKAEQTKAKKKALEQKQEAINEALAKSLGVEQNSTSEVANN